MENTLVCPSCQQSFAAQVRTDQLAEYVLCTHCQHRFFYDPAAAPDSDAPTPATPKLVVPEGAEDGADVEPPPASSAIEQGEAEASSESPPKGPSAVSKAPTTPVAPVAPVTPPPIAPPPAEAPIGAGYNWGADTGAGYETAPQEEYVMLFPTTARPLVGGIVLFIAAAIALANVVYLMDQHTEENSENTTAYLNDKFGWDIGWEEYHEAMQKVHISLSLLSLAGMVGAVMAMMRSSYAIARIGAICCLVAMGPFMVSTLLSAVALWLIITSRGEFKSQENEPPATGMFSD